MHTGKILFAQVTGLPAMENLTSNRYALPWRGPRANSEITPSKFVRVRPCRAHLLGRVCATSKFVFQAQEMKLYHFALR